MGEDRGPWAPEPPGDRPPPRVPPHRRLIWLAVVATAIFGVVLLFRAFPGQVSTPDDWRYVVSALAILALVSLRLLSAREIRWSEKARHAAIWAGIVGLFVLGFAYRDELAGVGRRVIGEVSPYGAVSGDRELAINQDENGSFFVMGEVNGQPVRFLIDTGASDTVLSPADAQRLGINTASLTFDHPAETANGVGFGARFVADSIAVGPIRFSGVPMVVNGAPMSSSLLGMTFLARLESFQVRGHKLYLKWRG